MKIECTHKEWAIIEGCLRAEYETHMAYYGETFAGHLMYDDELVFTIHGKFTEAKCE
jgi:hypothetical protein